MLTKLQNFAVRGVSLAEYISLKKWGCGLEELRTRFGDRALLELLSEFCGLYLKLPHDRELRQFDLDLKLAGYLEHLRASKKAGDLEGVVTAEQRILKLCQRVNKKYRWGVERAEQVLADLPKLAAKRQSVGLYKAKNLR